MKMATPAAVLGLVAATGSFAAGAAATECPPSIGDVEARVVPRVDYDPGSQTFTYRYTLKNLRSSQLPLETLGLGVTNAEEDISSMQAPEGWTGSPAPGIGGKPDVLYWDATKVEHPNRATNDPSIPQAISALEPGKTLEGFVLESPLPPGPATAYITGQVHIEPVSSEAEMERIYRECETVGTPMLEAARKVRTAGPAEGNFRPIRIDIMPGSADNPVNPDKKGVVPVAVLGSSDLAVSQIDPASLRFGPEGAAPAHPGHEPRDIDGDGLLDLLVHFDAAEAGLACLDSVAFVQGETVEGGKVQGFDTLTTPGCRGQGRRAGKPD